MSAFQQSRGDTSCRNRRPEAKKRSLSLDVTNAPTKPPGRWMVIWKLADLARFWIVPQPSKARGRVPDCPRAHVKQRPWREALYPPAGLQLASDTPLDFVSRDQIVEALMDAYKAAWGGKIPPAYLRRFPWR